MNSLSILKQYPISTKFFVVSLMLMLLDFSSLGFLFFYIPFTYFIFHKGYRMHDAFFYLLLLFGFSYGIIYFSNNEFISYTSELIFIINYPIVYLMGKYLVKYNDEKSVVFILFLLVFSIAFISMTSTLSDIASKGFYIANPLERDVHLIGVNSEEDMAATLISARLMPLAFFFIFFILPYNSKFKILFVSLAVVALFCIVRIQSRTAVIGFLSLLLITPILTWKSRSLSQKFILVMGIIAILAAGYYIISRYSSELAVIDRLQGEDMATGNGRLDRFKNVLANVGNYPLGNMPSKIVWAHNIWLDCARVTGIIPFVLLIFVTLSFMFKFFNFIRNKSIPFVTRTTIGFLSFAMFLTFSSEPTLEGVPTIFVFFCLLTGIITAFNNKKKSPYKRY